MKLADAMKNPLLLISQEIFLRRATTVVNFVLVCLLTYILAELTWKIIPGPVSLPPPPPPVDRTSAVSSPAAKTWDIARWHLFGVKERVVSTAPVRPEQIPETKLKLILRGIFASDDPFKGGAIIADPRREENFYSVGAQLPGNATLKEIYPDRVVLMRNNQLETLRLPKESLDIGNDLSGSSLAPASRGSTAADNGVSLREYRDTLINEPQRLADLVHIEPVNDANQFIGYKVEPGNDQSFFERFGLQPGDVITSVNGIVLDTPAKGLNVLRSLPDSNQYTIELLRNGQIQSFMIDLNN